MFLVGSDKKAAKDGKYQILEDGGDKVVEDGGPELGAHGKIFKKRDILQTILIGAIFFAFAWITMSMSKHHSPYTASIEKQIGDVTSNIVNNTKSTLAEVEQRSSDLKKHHELIATHFLDTIADDLTRSTNVSIQNLDRLVQETIHDINHEMDLFESGVSDGFDAFVTVGIEKMEKLQTSAASENDVDVVTKLIAEAAATIDTLLQDSKQMYLFYARYLTNVLENKLKNCTDKMSMLLHSQRRFVAAKSTERINLCYNVCTQNTKTSRLLRSMLDTMSAIGNTTDLVNGLKSIHQPDGDERAQHSVTQSKSTLAHAMESARQLLDRLLVDDFCYLGSTVRNMAAQRHGPFKRLLLKKLTDAVDGLHAEWVAVTSNFEVIRAEQRRRMSQLEKSAQTLIDTVHAKARRNDTDDGSAELATLAEAQATLTQQFDNITSEVNAIFATSRKYTSESLRNYLRFTVDRQLARIPALSIQNFIPDDLCPLAMNYQAFIAFTLNAAMGRDTPDVVDELFTLDEVSGDELRSVESDQPSSDDRGIRIMVVSLDDESPPNNAHAADSTEQGAPPELTNLLTNALRGLGIVDYAAETGESSDVEKNAAYNLPKDK